MNITINTDCNAPCCPCEIVADDGRSILVQSDWDYPGFASTFGFNLHSVQRCPQCGTIHNPTDESLEVGRSGCPVILTCENCEHCFRFCEHNSTDGTVDCKVCGLKEGDFIAAAYDFLRDHDGLTVDDPGYFDAD